MIHDKDFNLDNCQFDLTSHFNGKPKKALWTSTYLNSEEISDCESTVWFNTDWIGRIWLEREN